jgi:predicted lipoprotein with Yx(FWY)xxD motif
VFARLLIQKPQTTLEDLEMKRLTSFALLALTALALAGCGDSSDSSSTTAAQPAATKTPAGTVSTKSTDVGTVLSGEDGKTLYLFEADKNGKPTCSGDCAAAWPPAIATGSAKASGDADQSKLGTVTVSGVKQLTYAGHPLYYYVKDTDAEDVYGNGIDSFGAEWYALTPSGANAEETGSDDSQGSGY